MMRYVGTLSAWNDEKGYGFITPRGGGKEVFLHITACRLPERPYQGLSVSYELGTDGKGRTRAERVFPADWQPEETSSVPLAVPVAFSFLGLAALLGQTLLRGLPEWLLIWFVGVSLFAFLAYGYDKRQAALNGWRTAEKTLHLAALAGGWPGALAAQHVFRHKLRKPGFMVVFWLTVAVNLAVVFAAPMALASAEVNEIPSEAAR